VSTYFGAFASIFFISYADLLGRKATLVLSTGIQLLGTLILASSFNIWIAVVGLFLMGLGSASAFRVGFIILAEIFDNT
jgi:MFS family permease